MSLHTVECFLCHIEGAFWFYIILLVNSLGHLMCYQRVFQPVYYPEVFSVEQCQSIRSKVFEVFRIDFCAGWEMWITFIFHKQTSVFPAWFVKEDVFSITFVCLLVCLFCFWDKVSLCSPGWSRSHRDPPASSHPAPLLPQSTGIKGAHHHAWLQCVFLTVL